jgi:hypothetical protein
MMGLAHFAQFTVMIRQQVSVISNIGLENWLRFTQFAN